MRGWLAVLGTLVACAGTTHHAAAPAAPPTLHAWTVASGTDFTLIAADDRDVYWVSDGISRRPHDGGPIERLFASQSGVSYLTLGHDDVYFVDGSGTLRAIAKKDGGPSELSTLSDSVWGLAADDKGVWVGLGARLEHWTRAGSDQHWDLADAASQFVVDGDRGYLVMGGALVEIDLASGKTRSLSTDTAWQGTTGLAVVGDRVLGAYQGGLVAVPRAGGAALPLLAQPLSGFGADVRGWAASDGNALVAGSPMRVIATTRVGHEVGTLPTLALGGGFVYHVDYDDALNLSQLRGDPRDVGAPVLPVAADHTLESLAVDLARGDVYAAYSDATGDHLARLAAGGETKLADLPGFASGVQADRGDVAVYAEGNLYRLARGTMIERSADVGDVPLALHKGLIYWGGAGTVSALPLTGKKLPFTVADASRIGLEPSVPVSAIAFTEDHLYYTLPNGLAKVDEHGHDELVWSADGDMAVDPHFAIIDQTAYVNDGTRVLAVPIDGGNATPIYQTDGGVLGLWAAGGRLIAWVSDSNGEAFLALAPGKPRELWRAMLDGGHAPFVAVSDDTLYIASPELGGVIAIALQNDQPSASP